jgi:hypothetical protein
MMREYVRGATGVSVVRKSLAQNSIFSFILTWKVVQFVSSLCLAGPTNKGG